MSSRRKAKQFRQAVRNVDDVLFLLTGSRLKDVIGRSVDVFGKELARNLEGAFTGEKEPALPPDNPYAILGIHPGAMEVVVKAAYRALAKEFHPDTGTKPDPAKFQKATEAYDKIMQERRRDKEATS